MQHIRIHLILSDTESKFLCHVLVKYCKGVIKCFLTGNITNWQGMCTTQDRTAIKPVIKTTQNIISIRLPSISNIDKVRCMCETQRISKDKNHTSQSLFILLPSDNRYRSICWWFLVIGWEDSKLYSYNEMQYEIWVWTLSSSNESSLMEVN